MPFMGASAHPPPGPEAMDTTETETRFQEETYAVYLLDWTVVGGLQYVGITTDLEARIETHRRAGTLPFRTLGEPEVSILARATVAVANLDGKAHEADAQKLVDQGTGKVLEHYLAACSVVAAMVH